MSVATFEPDARPFPGARQGFDPRATTTFKKDGQTTEHPRSFVTSLTADEANAARLAALARGQWSVENPNHWRHDALWGEDRCRLRHKNAACARRCCARCCAAVGVRRCGSSSASPPAPPTASNSSPNAPSRDKTQKPWSDLPPADVLNFV